MDALPATAARPLLDILGGRWRVQVRANAVAWDGDGRFAGFALDDGSLALAPASWKGGPVLRPREGGGGELVPATEAAPPIARARAHDGRCLTVAGDPDGGFLTGGPDGRVKRVQTDGQVSVVSKPGGQVTALAAGRGRWRVCASERHVYRLGASAATIDVGGVVTSLAVEPSGGRVAIGHEGGVTLWAGGTTPRVLPVSGVVEGVAWSGDGNRLCGFTPDGAVVAWRMPDAAPVTVRIDARVLAPSGNGFALGAGGRVYHWDGSGEPVACGVANQVAVTRVAGHPTRTLIASGYANGTVVLCQPGSTALLFVRAAGEGSVSALQFSRAGDSLAIGTDGGEIGVLALPDALFRDTSR